MCKILIVIFLSSFLLSFSLINITGSRTLVSFLHERDPNIFEIRLSTQTTETNHMDWYSLLGVGGAPMKTTITYDNSWENNENGGTRSIIITLEEDGFTTGDKIRINSLYLIIIISLFETHREEDGTKFEKNNVNVILEPGGNTQYSTTFQVSYTGGADQVSFCLHVNYDFYIYDPQYGSYWWGDYDINPICAQINTKDTQDTQDPQDPPNPPNPSTTIPFGNLSIMFVISFILISLYSIIIIKKSKLHIQN